MYISEDEAQRRIQAPANLSNVVAEVRRRTGRPTGSRRLSPQAREIVALAARVLPPVQVAQTFGITRKTVSDLKRGVTSHVTHGRQEVNQNLKDNVDKKEQDRKAVVQERALDILLATLEELDPTKIEGPIARAKVAKEMAAIHEKMRGDGPGEGLVKVVVYAPGQKALKDYDVIDIQGTVVVP